MNREVDEKMAELSDSDGWDQQHKVQLKAGHKALCVTESATLSASACLVPSVVAWMLGGSVLKASLKVHATILG